MPTDDELLAARDRAVEKLLHLPGVTAVGIGGRERGGHPTGELVLRVYVEAKRPLADLAPEEVIPAEVEGIPVDVAEMGTGTTLAGPPGKPEIPADAGDDSRVRPLRGGTKIASDLFGSGWGTLGCFLRHATDPAKTYALTNWHVLQGETLEPTPTRTRVGQPSSSDSITKCCSNLFGTVAGGGWDSVRDAGVVQLDAGMEWQAEILDIGVVRGSHSVSVAEAGTHAYQVRKRGYRSRLTGGTVDSIGATVTLDDGAVMKNVTIIKPNPDPNLPGPTPIYFGQEGDSGAAVVNDANEVVGLLFARVYKGPAIGQGWALPIDVVLAQFLAHEKLSLVVATATTPGTVNTVPAAMVAVPPELVPGLTEEPAHDPDPAPSPVPGRHPASSPVRVPARKPLLVPAARPWLAGVAVPTPAVYAHLQADLDRWAAGRVLISVWLDNQLELTDLVNRNRRVAVGWHRMGGPALLQLFIRMLDRPTLAMPTTVHGVPLRDCLDRLCELFTGFGTARLRADLARARAAVPDLAGLTYPQIIDAVAGP